MLLLAFAALAVAPLFLAFRGAPTPAESLLFALSLTPAWAAILVARSGDLALGHSVAAAGYAGVAVALLFGLAAGPAVAMIWLVAAELETEASLDPRIMRGGRVVSAALALAVVACSFRAVPSPTVSPGTAALLAGMAVLASMLAAHRLVGGVLRRRESDVAVEERRRALDAVLDTVVVNLSGDGSVLAVSKPDESFLVLPEHALLGQGLFDHVLVADRPIFRKTIDDAARQGGTVVATFRLQAADRDAGAVDNSPRFQLVEIRARRIAGKPVDSSKVSCDVVATLTDVSGRDRREAEYARAQDAAEQALLFKDQFLTMMSHELRTPLNSIIGFSELLASRTTRPNDVARQCEFARTINRSGQHLLAIVNKLLDVSRIQCGSYTLRPEPFDAMTLLNQAADAVAGSAREGSLRLKRDVPGALEEMIGDRHALREALVALLDNAVKFTPAGGHVTLAARPEGNSLLISVADSGIGIAAADLAQIGDPFRQAAASTDRPFDGSGLGLALARGLVGLHGGTIALESELGLGTRVTLKLPLDCRNAVADVPAPIVKIALHTRQRRSSQIKDAA